MKKIIGLLTALVLFCTCMPLVVAEETVELPTLTDLMAGKNITWYYTDDPVRLEQITDLAWTQVGFDDTGWLTSSEQSFGARDGALEMLDGDYLPDVCLRQYKPDGRNIPTYYFRLPFVAAEEDQGHTLLFEFAYDDAIIMYLNGQKVFSVNVPEEGYETSNDFGALKATVAPKETSFELDTSLLAMGENVLAVELHQDSKSSSDIYFGIEAIESPTLSADLRRNETLCLGVGADETQCLVTWRGVAGQQAYVEVAPGTLDTLPQDAKRYEATEVYTDDKVCTYRAVVTDLTPGPYSYRAVDERPSLVNTFTVSKAGTSFTFLCHGDPQILDGRSTSPIEHYDELAALVAGDTEIQFVLSLGDQSNTNDALDLFQRYTSAELLKRVPLAAVVGNHEFSSGTFSRFFYMPNMDEQTIGTSGDMSGDYWFCCGNMLVFCLNSENENVASHRRFMLDAREKCIALYGEPTWTIVAMHYSMFSQGRHSDSDTIQNTREAYASAFQDAGVQVVFSGHDHSYTRSWPMDGKTPIIDGDSWEGIVYFCLGSSTGTKYYSASDEMYDYTAMCDWSKRPYMTQVDVMDDIMKVATYYESSGSLKLLDEYVITQSKSK